MNLKIETLSIDDAPLVFDWVLRLLVELGEEGDDLASLNTEKVLQEWRESGDRVQVMIARNDADEMVGILTVTETFAIYANGNYGIINEMYVHPDYRSEGVGSRLIEAIKDYGRRKGWARIDVTAPESERWERTRRFYEKEGFVFSGPKLKFLL